MYAAERGSGAFLNGRRLRVSGRRAGARSALFATGIPFLGLADHALFLRQLRSVMAVSFRGAAVRLGRAGSGLRRGRPL